MLSWKGKKVEIIKSIQNLRETSLGYAVLAVWTQQRPSQRKLAQHNSMQGVATSCAHNAKTGFLTLGNKDKGVLLKPQLKKEKKYYLKPLRWGELRPSREHPEQQICQ